MPPPGRRSHRSSSPYPSSHARRACAYSSEPPRSWPPRRGGGMIPRCGGLEMLIKDLVRAAGVTPQVVRFYARTGLITPCDRHENGYRSFDVADIERVKFILRAKKLGLTLNEIRGLLSAPDVGSASCCDRLRADLEGRLSELRERIAEFELLASRIESRLERWRTSGCEVSAIVSCPVLTCRAGRPDIVRSLRTARDSRRHGRSSHESLPCEADSCTAATCKC